MMQKTRKVTNVYRYWRARVAQRVRLLEYITTHRSLSQIRNGFAPGFVNYKKKHSTIRASDKVYQLLAQCRWFSPISPASSTTNSDRHDIVEVLLKVKHQQSNQIKSTGIGSEIYVQCSTQLEHGG